MRCHLQTNEPSPSTNAPTLMLLSVSDTTSLKKTKTLFFQYKYYLVFPSWSKGQNCRIYICSKNLLEFLGEDCQTQFDNMLSNTWSPENWRLKWEKANGLNRLPPPEDSILKILSGETMDYDSDYYYTDKFILSHQYSSR
jgi:hypothetical protein